jgi:hypothetical protein
MCPENIAVRIRRIAPATKSGVLAAGHDQESKEILLLVPHAKIILIYDADDNQRTEVMVFARSAIQFRLRSAGGVCVLFRFVS